jgi:lactoylglutathione lyase
MRHKALMTLKAASIDHVNIPVKNLQKSVDFYCALFGFKILKEQPEQKSKIIGNKTIKLCIYETDGAGHGNWQHRWGFHVENFKEIEATCKEMGVDMPYGVVTWEEGTRSIYIKDPDGYEIELAETNGGGL